VIIVLEGVDGVGKTGLVAALVRRFIGQESRPAVHLYHYGPPPFDNTNVHSRAQQASDDLRRALEHGNDDNTHIIIDRWSWGCPVYGPIFRPALDDDGYGELGSDMFFQLEERLDDMGGRTFWLDAPMPTIASRIGARGDWYLHDETDRRLDQISRLRARYAELAPKCKTYTGTFQLLDPPDTDALARRIENGEFHA
jgi:thymidylate kinase